MYDFIFRLYWCIQVYAEILLVYLPCEHRDALKAQMQVNKDETQYTVTIEQLRSELERSYSVSAGAKKLQAQQSLEMEKLKVALGNETVHAENEREAKQEALRERYTDA